MLKVGGTIGMRAKLTRLSVPVFVVLVLFPTIGQSAEQTGPPAVTDIRFSFKLDPRLLGGTYAGERWTSPEIYHGAAAQDTVEAKVVGVGSKGEAVDISPKWMPSDPDMVTVSPDHGSLVSIKVKRAGESRLEVTLEGVSTALLIRSEYLPKTNVIQVHITQPSARKVTAPHQPNPYTSKTPEKVAGEYASAFSSKEAKLSYAMGVQLGDDLRKKPIEVDADALSQGLKDALTSGELLISAEESRVLLAKLKNDARKQQLEETSSKQQALAVKNQREGEAFLTENKSKEGVVTLASGLQYKVLKEGAGQKPGLMDRVLCNYRGTFVDGTEFADTVKRGRPAAFMVATAIPAWREALQLMPVGSKWQLFVPSQLAYGIRGTRTRPAKNGATPKQLIGPNAVLLFELELVLIENGSRPASQQAHSQDDFSNEASAPSEEINQ
jgi:FKBP-type peptidyl-prolyl cis-trans isomerase FklB